MNFYRWPYLILLLLLTFLSACGPLLVKPVSDYKTLTSNTDQLSTLGGGAAQKIAVDDFTITKSRIDLGRCEGSIQLKEISVFDAKIPPFEEYIRNALISELEGANLYSATSKKSLGVNIDYMDLTTTSIATFVPGLESLTDSKWSITATFKGKGVNSFTIPSIYLFPFKDSFFDGPCVNPRNKFDSAIANLIKILVNHPSFKEFLAAGEK
jgi:hypothetical protein